MSNDYRSATTDFKNYSAAGFSSLRKIFELLNPTELFRDDIERIRNSEWFPSLADGANIPSSADTQIKSFLTLLRTSHKVFAEYFSKFEVSDPHLITVYLPGQYSFGELQNLSNELKKAIEIPVLDVQGKVEISKAFPGSIWLEVLLGSSAAVAVVGRIVKVATTANTEVQKGKILSNYAKSIALSNEHQEGIIAAQKKIIERIISEGASNIVEHSDGTAELEKIERMKLSIKTMSELLNQGIRVLPSTKEEAVIRSLFPQTQESSELIEGEIKRLVRPPLLEDDDIQT